MSWHWIEDPLPPPRCSCGVVAMVIYDDDPSLCWCEQCAKSETSDMREAMRANWPF